MKINAESPEVKWKFGPRGLIIRDSAKHSRALIQRDPAVPRRKEFMKETHPNAAIIAAPAILLEAIKERHGENLVPAVDLDVRALGAIPVKMTGLLMSGDFSEIYSTEWPFSAIALHHGPYAFYGRIGLADPQSGTFHAADETALPYDFVPVGKLPEMGVALI